MHLSTGAHELAMVRRVVGLSEVRVPLGRGGGRRRPTARLAMPRCQDRLLDLYIEEEAAMAHRTPYYGVIWPSALGLARSVSRVVQPGDAVLELGSGLGLGGIAAALTASPSTVLCADHDPAAARLCRLNGRLSGVGSVVRSAALDWTATLDTWPAHAFDCAIAADIIYEEEAVPPIAAVLKHVLRPGARFLLADGEKRRHRASLALALESHGAFVRRHEGQLRVDPGIVVNVGAEGGGADISLVRDREGFATPPQGAQAQQPSNVVLTQWERLADS